MEGQLAATTLVAWDTHPSRYRHWQLTIQPPLAWLTLNVAEQETLSPGYTLKLNSYDLSVDFELADAVNRLRFEHPDVRAVIVTSGRDRVFCAGANIPMLAMSGHGFKVNFCKFTNETRLAIEDACAHSGQHYIAACNGSTAGGGYELALACEEIYLVDDGSSAVSLPETPLLGVLPGTGGLTRLLEKRKVRRDLADVFATTAEGVKGRRAVEWGLVDGVFPRSQFAGAVRQRALDLAGCEPPREGPGVAFAQQEPVVTGNCVRYPHVTLDLDHARRTARLTIRPSPSDSPIAWFRELDDALLRLRFHYDEIGVVQLHTSGELETAIAADKKLEAHADDWRTRETILLMARTLRRMELTARSFFAVIDRGSCFAGSLLEIALAADRIYMLDDEDRDVRVATSWLNYGRLPMTNGATRLEQRYLGGLRPDATLNARDAAAAGLVTFAVDELDWDDTLRVAVEERASLSPDALTAMESNLRFAGPETRDAKIFGRLSAWQNWVFSRPNATGPRGALTLYGKPERPQFDWRRT